MRLRTFLAAIVGFVVVAGLTVRLQVRAAIRAYQIGREQEELRWLRQRLESLQARVEARYSPNRVFVRSKYLRDLRAGRAGPPEI